MKLKYEDIKQEIESEGWKLLSDSYVNMETQMEFKCPNGHNNFYTFRYWRKHRDCPVCKENKYYKMSDSAPRPKGFRILAFDQAANTTGWSVFDGDELIKFGHWTSNGTDTTSRIAKTKQWVANMIQVWNPDLVVFEDIQLQKSENGETVAVTTYKILAFVLGTLTNYCYENGKPFIIVSSATWREYSQIKGRTRTDKKRNAQFKIKELYDVNPTQDEADAVLIGRWAANDQKKNRMITF